MADARMNIVITAVNEAQKVLDDAATKIAALGKGLEALGVVSAKKAEEGFTKEEEAAKKAALAHQRMQEGILKLHDGFEKLVWWVKAAAGGFLAFESIRFLKELADVAARTEVLGIVMNVVARNAGITGTEITKTDLAIQKLGITASASRQSLAQFIQAGLDISKAGELARTAQNLAVISGENSSVTFQRMVNSIQTLDTLSLRFMGLTIDNTQAQERYAVQIGKSAGALTEIEKRQALMNAVQFEGKKIGDIYVESMTAVGKQMGSLQRYVEEAQKSLGNNLLPAYLAIVMELEKFMHHMELFGDGIDQQGKGAQRLAEVIRTIAHALFSFTEFVVDHYKQVLILLSVWAGYATVFKIAKVAETYMTIATAAKAAEVAIKGASTAQAASSLAGKAGALGSLFVGAVAAGYYATDWIAGKMGLNAPSGAGGNKNTNAMLAQYEDAKQQSDRELGAMNAMPDKGGEAYKKASDAHEETVRTRIASYEGLTKRILELDKIPEAQRTQQDRAEYDRLRAWEKEHAAVYKKVYEADQRYINQMEASKALGLDKINFVGGQLNTQANSMAIAGFQRLMGDFVNKTRNNAGELEIDFNRIRLGLLHMVASAKDAKDFTAVLQKLGESSTDLTLLKTTISELSRTAWVNRQKEEMKDLDTIMSGYTAKLKDLKTVQDLLTTTAGLAHKEQMTFMRGEAQLAFDKRAEYEATRSDIAYEAELQKGKYERDLAWATDTQKRKTALVKEEAAHASNAIYDREMEAKRQLKQEGGLSDAERGEKQQKIFKMFEAEQIALKKDTARRTVDIDIASQRERIQISRAYFDEVKKAEAAYYEDHLKHAREVINTDNRIRDARERFNKDTREGDRSLMSDAGARLDKEKEIQEYLEKGHQAEADKRIDLARKYYDQAYSMAATLQTAPGMSKYAANDLAFQKRKEATEAITKMEESQNKIEKEADTASMQSYLEKKAQVQEMKNIMDKMGSEQIVNILPQLNSSALWTEVNKVVEDIKEKITNAVEVTVKLADGAASRVRDEMQAYFNTNPIQVAAQGMMGTLGSMGNLSPAGVGATGPSFASNEGGAATGMLGRYSLDITRRGAPVGSLQGSRETVMAAADAYKDMARGM